MRHQNPLSARTLRVLGSISLLALTLLAGRTARSADTKPAPDVLVFINGDLLTGKFLRSTGGTVTFHSDIVGDVNVDWAKVKELRSSQKFAVLMNNQKVTHKTPSDQVAQGTISMQDQAIKIESDVAGKTPAPIAVKDAAFVIDQTTFQNEVYHQPGFFHAWTGTVAAGASFVEATQNSQNLNLGIALSRVIPTVSWLAPRNRTTANVTDIYGHVTQPNTAAAGHPSNAQDTKTSIFHADAERDEYLTPRFYALANLSYDHNFSQGLDLQQIYGGGFGYTVIKQPTQELDVKADVHYERQAFTGVPVINLVGSSFGEAYWRKLTHGMMFTEGGVFNMSFNDTNAYSSNVAAALVFPVYKRFSFNVGAGDSFVNNPPAGFKKNSFQLTSAISYTLK